MENRYALAHGGISVSGGFCVPEGLPAAPPLPNAADLVMLAAGRPFLFLHIFYLTARNLFARPAVWSVRGNESMSDTSCWAGRTFEEVVEAYSDLVTRICLLRLRNNIHDARDCYQNVFLKLYQKRPHFENETHLKAWLIRVASNACTDFARQFRRREAGVTAELTQLAAQPEDRELLQSVLALPGPYAEVVYLHYYEGYRVAEIAALLKSKENTVKSQLLRAQALLKLQLGGAEDE